jgi:hypothetical protein
MRSTIVVAFTAILLAPTAAMASLNAGGPAGTFDTGTAAAATAQKLQLAPSGDAATGQPGFTGRNLILAKGDQSGNGPGAGGQKGQKKGGHKGKQAGGKDNPGKAKGRS